MNFCNAVYTARSGRCAIQRKGWENTYLVVKNEKFLKCVLKDLIPPLKELKFVEEYNVTTEDIFAIDWYGKELYGIKRSY